MADLIQITAGAGTPVSTEDVTNLNGGVVGSQHVQRVATAIVTADGTAIDLTGTTAEGLDVDVTRVTPGTSATHLGKAEDAVAGSGDVGVMALGVRRDANTTLVDATGDYAPFQVDANGSLKVAIISGAGSGGTALADSAAFTAGTTNLTPIGGYRDDTAPDTVAEGEAAAVRITTNRAIHCNLRDAAGNELSVGGGTQYDEDTVSTAADKITMAGVVRKDAAATLVDTDGDRTQLQVDSTGRLWCNVSNTVTVAAHAVTNGGTFATQVDGAALTALQLIDDAVHADDATRGKSFLAGAVFDDTAPTAITENQAGYLRMSSRRALLVEGVASGTAMATTVSAALPAGTNNIGDVDVLTLPALPAGTNNIGDVDVLTIAAGENHLGQVGSPGDLLEVTLSLDTSAYADGDVHADSQVMTNAVRVNGGRAVLQSLVVIDEDDVGQTMDVVFFSANRSLGTENAAPSITDANARDCLGSVRVNASDFLDFGGVKVATVRGLGLLLEAAGGSRDLYAGTIIRGAGTYTASGVKLRVGLLWD